MKSTQAIAISVSAVVVAAIALVCFGPGISVRVSGAREEIVTIGELYRQIKVIPAKVNDRLDQAEPVIAKSDEILSEVQVFMADIRGMLDKLIDRSGAETKQEPEPTPEPEPKPDPIPELEPEPEPVAEAIAPISTPPPAPPVKVAAPVRQSCTTRGCPIHDAPLLRFLQSL